MEKGEGEEKERMNSIEWCSEGGRDRRKMNRKEGVKGKRGWNE